MPDLEYWEDGEYEAVTESLIDLFINDRISLKCGREWICFDDFTGYVLPESAEYINLCRSMATGEKLDFNQAFDDVLRQCVEHTINSIPYSEVIKLIEDAEI